MYLPISLTFLAIITLTPTTALPTLPVVDYTQYKAPTSADSRAPCPGLNSLANHGILPRSGRSISILQLLTALTSGYKMDLPLATVLSEPVLTLSSDPSSGKFDLANLYAHGRVEHDVSLSRGDLLVTGDALTFNRTIFNGVMAQYGVSTSTSIDAAARARMFRERAARAENSRLQFGPKDRVISYGETSLYLSALGDPADGVVPVSWVKTFFEEERLPFVEGWLPPKAGITLMGTNVMISRLVAATPGDSVDVTLEQAFLEIGNAI